MIAPFAFAAHGAVVFSDKYKSPRSAERKARKSTTLIVLHTTEAPGKSSLKKLSERGEAHYCVDEDGTIYRIVDRKKEAFHAGRSMWAGKEDCDKFSIGIEVVGYHDKSPTAAQLTALKELVRQLKSVYKLSDDKVVTHSQVAYAAPNKWHPKRCRGRKRCGMLFAMPSVRTRLGLKKRMASDPDVKAKRLVVGDKYLEGVLYGKTDTMKGKLPAAGAVKSVTQKSDTGLLAAIGNLFTPTPVKPPAGPPKNANANAAPKPKPKPAPAGAPATKAELDALVKGGSYAVAGPVAKGKSASSLVKGAWKKATTYYLIRNHVTPGDKIDEKRIEAGTMIYYKVR